MIDPKIQLNDSRVGRDNIQIGRAGFVAIVNGLRVSWWWLLVIASALIAFFNRSLIMDTVRDLRNESAVTATIDAPYHMGDSVALGRLFTDEERAKLMRGSESWQAVPLLHKSGGVRVGAMDVTVVLLGGRERAVKILDVRPKVIKIAERPAATCLTLRQQGAEVEYQIKANLDRLRPEGGRARYLPKSIDLTYGERATIELTVTAEQQSYEWEIEVSYVDGSGPEPAKTTFRASDGQPFRITGAVPTYRETFSAPGQTRTGYRLEGRNKGCPA
ncbi:hypothetical protein [Nonomuraea rubra]|uniref:hypothetical protein n=1 Tax=Nonomuraea rubra TaxID=46180 RepID=UPI0034064145